MRATRRQEKQVEELRQLEHRLPPDMEYSHIQDRGWRHGRSWRRCGL